MKRKLRTAFGLLVCGAVLAVGCGEHADDDHAGHDHGAAGHEHAEDTGEGAGAEERSSGDAGDAGDVGNDADAGAASATPDGTPDTSATGPGLLDRKMTALDGSERDLSQYKGNVVLIVNTASKCGLTPQYEGLQALYDSKSADGLVILGFPANDFRGQEPGTDEEIAAFCSENYGVTFPMFSKISVLGENQHPLYAELTAASEEPTWNFTKYLLDREGRLVQRFDPRTSPQDAALVAKVDELLSGE